MVVGGGKSVSLSISLLLLILLMLPFYVLHGQKVFFFRVEEERLLACSFLDVAWGHNPSSYESHFREGLEAAAGEEETERMSILCWA